MNSQQYYNNLRRLVYGGSNSYSTNNVQYGYNYGSSSSSSSSYGSSYGSSSNCNRNAIDSYDYSNVGGMVTSVTGQISSGYSTK